MQQGRLPVGLHVPHGILSPGGWLHSLRRRLLAKHLPRLNWSTAPSDRTLPFQHQVCPTFDEPHYPKAYLFATSMGHRCTP